MANKLSVKTIGVLLLVAIALYFLLGQSSGYAPIPSSPAESNTMSPTMSPSLMTSYVPPIIAESMRGPSARSQSMYGPSARGPSMSGPSAKQEVYEISGMNLYDDEPEYSDSNLSGSINFDGGCAMNTGVGLASSLMPRDIAPQEQYGQFAPDDILKGQNFLDPRQQVGWPETIGGTIRNGNQQLRADPPNPKDAYTWNNSTIVPDLMQRNLGT